MTNIHIDRGINSTLDKGGSDAADSVASSGAAHYTAPQALTEAATRDSDWLSPLTSLLQKLREVLLAMREADHG